jgi:Transglutaminase-like superfamily
LLVQVSLTLPLIAIGLVWPGFRRLHAWLARWPRPIGHPASKLPAEQWPQALATARLVQIAARRSPIRLNCLPRSLALWWWLHRQGIRADLRIGVTPKTGGLEAHAWVEFQGVVGRDLIAGKVLGRPLPVCTLQSLPLISEKVLLDIDVDYLVIPKACHSSDQYRGLPWCWPDALLAGLQARGVQADLVTIAYLVEGALPR